MKLSAKQLRLWEREGKSPEGANGDDMGLQETGKSRV
jgi:hypothetical protein